jgi:hypothetical protein
MRMYGRRRQITPEKTAANAKARAAREATTMHCQCCDKLFLANTGLMAHHGYQRPGGGWQTASCMGARYLPLEVSRDRLAELIKSLETWKARAIITRANVEAETQAISLTFPDYNLPRDSNGRRPNKDVLVTRETFSAIYAENSAAFRQRSGWNYFDGIKENDLRSRDREIKNVTDEITAQQARFDGWKQTHTWDNIAKLWQSLPKREG